MKHSQNIDIKLFLNNTLLPTPPLEQDMTRSQFLSGVQQVSIQSFPSRLTKAEEPSLPLFLNYNLNNI